MTTPADLRNTFGAAEFPVSDDTQLTAACAHADSLVSDTRMGAHAAQAKLYLAAHLATIATKGRGDGTVAASTGPVSQSWDTSDKALELTSYGKHYKWLIRTAPGPAMMVI